MDEIWKRQGCDTNKSFQAFSMYRNLGTDRTLEKVTSLLYFNGKKQEEIGSKFRSKLTQVMKWSSNNKWVKRIEAYEDYVDDMARVEFEEERIEAIKLQKDIAKSALELARDHIAGLEPGEVATRDITSLLKEAANIQRLCYGEATEHVKSDNKNEDIVIMIPDNSRE